MRLELDERHSVTVVGRGWWGAEDVEETSPLDHPITFVRFAYEDITYGGKDIIDGLMDTQTKYLEENYSDIPYNFIVDVTGTVYEGLGWTVEAQRPAAFQGLKNCLDICYVGDYKSQDANPPWEQLVAGMYLVMFGLKDKMISPQYKTIGWRDESLPAHLL